MSEAPDGFLPGADGVAEPLGGVLVLEKGNKKKKYYLRIKVGISKGIDNRNFTS